MKSLNINIKDYVIKSFEKFPKFHHVPEWVVEELNRHQNEDEDDWDEEDEDGEDEDDEDNGFNPEILIPN